MKKSFNNAVLSTIKKHMPDGEQIVPFLGNLLFLGKEAIYRRLRGDVVFTFDEVATISSKLGFSIDRIAGLKHSERAFFETNLYRTLASEDAYYNILQDYVEAFFTLNKSKVVVGHFVNNHLPYVFSIFLDTLSKFRYYKWMHQSNGFDSSCPMSEIVVPSKILDLQKIWMDEASQKKVHSTYIFDNNLFLTICRDVDYFHKNKLVNDVEVQYLQGELLSLVDFFEEVARTGEGPSGAPLLLYLTPFDLATNYMHFDFDNNSSCQVHLHSINHLQSFDPHVCDMQKNWINQLKRYSILITQSSEMQRLAYFNKQREYISEIGKIDA